MVRGAGMGLDLDRRAEAANFMPPVDGAKAGDKAVKKGKDGLVDITDVSVFEKLKAQQAKQNGVQSPSPDEFDDTDGSIHISIETVIKLLKGQDPFDVDKNKKRDDFEDAAEDAYNTAKKFDINGDGKLDDAEKAAMAIYNAQKALEKLGLGGKKDDSSDKGNPFGGGISVGTGINIDIDSLKDKVDNPDDKKINDDRTILYEK